VLYFPVVIGPITVSYNGPSVQSLKLSAPVIADIFQGKITTWNNSAIAADNPGVSLPNTPIVVARRSDSSGTTQNFSEFWPRGPGVWTLGTSSTINWPATSRGGNGNGGVASTVKSTSGAFGYVDYADAKASGLTLGVGFLLHGLLDYIVDGHFDTLQSLDDAIEALEDQLFSPSPQDREVQRRNFELRKSWVRRVVLPRGRQLACADLLIVGGQLQPYYQDVYDHVLRATEWTESLRDLVTTILETNLTIQGNRMNVITKKVTSWAAIIAVPTFITGIYGMNVPYPGFIKPVGLATSIAIMITAGLVLYVTFKRKDWLLQAATLAPLAPAARSFRRRGSREHAAGRNGAQAASDGGSGTDRSGR